MIDTHKLTERLTVMVDPPTKHALRNLAESLRPSQTMGDIVRKLIHVSLVEIYPEFEDFLDRATLEIQELNQKETTNAE